MSRKVAIIALLAFIVGLLGVPFLLRPEQEELTAQRELIVISPHWEGILYEFNRGFRRHWKEKTGELVKFRNFYVGGGTDTLRFVRSEFKRNKNGIGIDIYWGGGIDPFEEMNAEGILQPYKVSEEILKYIPPQLFGYNLYDPDYHWYGSAISGFGIIYNKKVLSILNLPEPKQWSDLANSACFSWVGSGDPANSSTAHAMYEFIMQGYGYNKGIEVLTLMGANTRRFDKHSSNVPQEVSIGEIAYGLAIDFYAGAAIASAGSDKLGFVYPEKMTVVNPDPVAILKGAPNLDLAQGFIEYLLSEEGQRLWMLKKGSVNGPKKFNLMRVSIRPDLLKKYKRYSAINYDPFALKDTLEYKQSYGSKRWTILSDFLRASLIDTHDSLTSAWQMIRRLPQREKKKWIDKLTKPLISEEEMFRLAKEEWQNPVKRNNYRVKWTLKYRDRYRQIATELKPKVGF